MENNSQQIGNMNFQNSNNNNIGFATHTREDNTDATSWLDNHAASSARLELPNYFQKTLLDRIVSVYQKKCLKGTFKTLVLVGAPGAGKTTLARGFIEWMFRCYNEMNYESAYMLFDHRDPAQHNARKVLLRILRWLVGHEHELNGKSYDTVQRAFAKCRPRKGHEWLQTATSCVDLLLEAISPHQREKRHFCVVLDALDEFTNDGELQTLCDQLARLQNQLNLTVVVTTRYPNQGAGKSLVRPCVETITAEVADVRGFATQSFAVSSETVVSSLRPGAKKYEDIIDEIVAKSSGIFSSVQLNVGYIASARNSDELNQLHLDLQGRRFDHSRKSDSAELVHSDIERNLRRVFGDAFELHETKLSEGQQQTLHIFACVLFARRPLSMQELWAAVEVNLRPKLERHDDFNRGTELYLKTCGLIHQHDQLLTVDFAHPHLRTYLTSKNQWQNLRWRVAQSCIDYIGLPVFQQGWCPRHIYEPIISRWPFVRYAAENWHYHYGELETLFGRNSEELEKSQRLFQSTMHFLSAPENIDFISLVMVQLGILHYPAAKATAQSTKGKEKVPTASSSKRPMASYDPTKPYGLNGLLIASLHGMSKLVDKLLDRASLQQKDQSTIKNETSAYLAAINGDVETLRTIIRKGLGTKTLNVRDTEGFPLICRAMLSGNIAIVQELLSDVQYNVDIGAAIECEELDEPYSLPGDRGLAELTGVANRLRKYTLLHQAAVAGCLDIVTRLLELGASPDVQDGFGMTPLHKAAKYGHLEIVKLLVKEGQVDPVAKVSNDKRTALHMASKYNHEKVASYLIRKFKDLPGVKASRDQLAIHHALLAGSQGIAAMLFEMQSKTPDFVSQLETLRVGDDTSASLGRRYTISLHTRSREDLSTLSPSTNNLKRRYTASEEEPSTPRYNLRSAKRQYLGAARSPSAALPELD